MNFEKHTPRLLGVAFLLQALCSMAAGLLLAPIDLLAVSMSGDVAAAMTDVANGALQMRASIVMEMVTAFGVIMLGVFMFEILKGQNRPIARLAMGLYLVEAALLAVREIWVFALLRISELSVAAGHPEAMQALGSLAYEGQSFGYTLHMVLFSVGAFLFYFLFYQSRYIPRILAIWGVIAASLAIVGNVFVVFGYDVPLIVFLPSLPLELAMGVWLLFKGIRVGGDAATGTAATA